MEKDKPKLTLAQDTGSNLIDKAGITQAIETGDKIVEESGPHGYLSEEDRMRIKALVENIETDKQE